MLRGCNLFKKCRPYGDNTSAHLGVKLEHKYTKAYVYWLYRNEIREWPVYELSRSDTTVAFKVKVMVYAKFYQLGTELAGVRFQNHAVT